MLALGNHPALFRLTLIVPLAASPAFCQSKVDYRRDIKPILKLHCVRCHGPLKSESGLRLDTRDFALKGGDNGPALRLQTPSRSTMIQRVTAKGDKRMPPEGAGLGPEEIKKLVDWIAAGAPAPANEVARDPRSHWSYRTIQRPEIPRPRGTRSYDNPIDAFVAVRQQHAGVRPQQPARPQVLLRRVYLDLIGLPPTRQQLVTFLNDRSPRAYERVIDQLLASPHYGERWGRHWLDIWRYSDWYGFQSEVRFSQKNMWHWRDWVVESLNQDKGYQRMVMEMIAGDEMKPFQEGRLRATGFLVRNRNTDSREQWIRDTIEHTSKAFLAITFACVQCHDHPYDPIAQVEYYRFRNIFEAVRVNLDGKAPWGSDETAIARIFDRTQNEKTKFYVRGNDRTPDLERKIEPGIPLVLGGWETPQAVGLSAAARIPALRPRIRKQMLLNFRQAIQRANQAVTTAQNNKSKWPTLAVAKLQLRVRELELDSYKKTWRAETWSHFRAPPRKRKPTKAERAALDRHKKRLVELGKLAQRAQRKLAQMKAQEDKQLAQRALTVALKDVATEEKKRAMIIAAARRKLKDAQNRITRAEKALTAKLNGRYQGFPSSYGSSSGRRLSLAKWIASHSNPLTARVAVNHIWMRHFGRPLVDTVFDFGIAGKAPSHPLLLDWLATELKHPKYVARLRSGRVQWLAGTPQVNTWSMKHLHKLIVMSRTYRSASTMDANNARRDPDNRWLWRMMPRRMTAEVVRDSVLAAANVLDRRLGGPDLPSDDGMKSLRRSLYFHHSPEDQMAFLKLFDGADATECYQRHTSIVPHQALAMFNSRLCVEQSRRLARQLSREFTKTESFIQASFQQVLSRSASTQEVKISQRFLAGQEQQFRSTRSSVPPKQTDQASRPSADPRTHARENFVHSLFNHHEFVTIR